MSQKKLYQITEWTKILNKEMSHLSKPQIVVLAMWSFAASLLKDCSLTATSIILSICLEKKENSVRQRLREFYKEASKKSGSNRKELVVKESFAPLLKWIMRYWPGKQLPLAMDATTLADKFTILSLSVVYRSCAIPVAWKITKGNIPYAWKPEWIDLISSVKDAVSSEVDVLVLTDRGISSRDIFEHIKSLGWHPFLRIKLLGSFRPEGKVRFYPLKQLIPEKGCTSQSTGTLYKGNPFECTLFTFYGENANEPWLIITDIQPEDSDPAHYALRFWIEQGFRTIKRGGLQWHKTRIEDPLRAERTWLVLSVSLVYLLLFGTQRDIFDSPQEIVVHCRLQRRSFRRHTSVFRKGWFCFLLALLFDSFPSIGNFVPEKFPTHDLKLIEILR